MRNKRILSLFLCFIMMVGLIATPAFAAADDAITVFLSVSQYGELVKDKDSNTLALAPVELTGKDSYNLDDVFKALHDTYYYGGSSAGYSSDEGQYGLYVTKLWGDTSGNFGYQVNGGTESVMGLTHEVSDGDYVDAVIYENSYPDTESYTKFNKYTERAYVGEPIDLTLSQAGYDENWNTVFSPCDGAAITTNGSASGYTTDANGKATLSFDKAGTYTVSATKEKTVNSETVTAITAPICVITVSDLPDAAITVPNDATLFVGTKGGTHYVRFTEVEPVYHSSNESTTTYYFELSNNSTYNYRVSGEEYITYGGTFNKTADFSKSVTEDMLKPTGKTKTTVDRDTSSNKGYNVADIYLNINPQGYLKLEKDDTFQIVSLRNWQAVDGIMSNYFIEPDYHYEVIDENGNASDVVTIDNNGILTAAKSGTAIVLVKYDAMTLNYGSDDFYGAIYPENTGVFVVSVDSEDSEIETGITLNEGKNNSAIKLSGDKLDSEHDCIYYVGEQGEYTFTPVGEDIKVYIANPVIENEVTYNGFTEVAKNDDNSFTVPLLTGRNIVKLEKDGKTEYQIITAKKVNVTINNGEAVHPGDTVSVAFDTLYHPANKLAGIYNMNAIAVYTDVSGYDGKIVGSTSAQYNFANTKAAHTVANVLKEKNTWGSIDYVKDIDLTVPTDFAYDTFTLSGGAIYVSGWGDSYGNHRYITYETGKAPNLNADAKLGYLAKLPDIEIPVVATTSELESITLDTENVKTDYFAGDKFDKTGLVVTANYQDETTQIATNYSVSPEVLSADTDKVTVTYKGKTAEIPVTVTNPKVVSIEISAPPTKTAYTEGETFSPSGMVVNCVYENGVKKETSDYSYSPNRELTTSDTQMTISYTGENAASDIESVTQAITVAEKSSSGGSVSSNKITVYFTLLGDSNHGTPTGTSDTHTKKKNNLDTWISKTSITLDKGSYVIDVVEKALSLNGIPYKNEGNYISSIKGLAEFDNGNLSGWMYTLNGKYPTKGVSEQKLSNGDSIIFHYTDDYTAENTGYSGGSSSSSSSSSSSVILKPTNNKDTETDTTDTPAVSEENTEENSGSSAAKFDDVAEEHWAHSYISTLASKGIINGDENGNFNPEDSISRAEFCAILSRCIGEDIDTEGISGTETPFSDVLSDAWYSEYVALAFNLGIVNGVEENTFAPDASISRQDMSVMIMRFADKMGIELAGSADAALQDAGTISDYAADAVAKLAGCGIIGGDENGNFNPKNNAARAEAAKMIYLLLFNK